MCRQKPGGASRGSEALPALELQGSGPRTKREHIPVVLSHPVGGDLSRQPRKTDTVETCLRDVIDPCSHIWTKK